MENEIDNLNFEDSDDDYDPNDPNKPKKKKVIELSDQEIEKIKSTIEEMKKNKVQPQVSVGRVYNKPGFVSKPPKIIYKDFEIGVKMSQTITITNCSYSFNSFQLQNLDDDIIDFFEIDYQSCGRIPAGISTKMTLHFTPVVNKDYHSSLKLLSETGMCVIPIECYCKKCLISFENENIDYGEVILGQEIILPLVVKNDGALQCKFTIVDEDKELLTNKEDEDEKEKDNELDSSYKDFIDRKIILHKEDYLNDKGNDDGIIDIIKKKRVDEYRIKVIQEEKENYEKEEKEKQEKLEEELKNNPKAAKDKGKKKPGKEPEIELVDGIPKERMEEVEKKVEEFSQNFKIKDEEDQKQYDEMLAKIQFDKMKFYMLKQLRYPLHGQFNGYSKKNVSLILNAKYIGEYSLKCFMKIEYKGQIEYKEFNISFKVVDLPIYSEKKIYDLHHIIINEIFREKIVLVNKSNYAYKLQIFYHRDLSDFVELNPSLGYIQANSTFDIWLKLKVDKTVENLISFFKGQDTKDNIEYNFPLKIVLNNIKIPLITIIHFFLTGDKIKISDKMINYGKRYLDEKSKVKISLENTSLLPMKYGFIMLPKEFTVRLNIDNILSKEKTFVNIIYESKDGFSGHREGDIFCRVITDDLTTQNIKIKYHIELVNPELELKPKKICFQSLPEGEFEELRILITNKSEFKSFDCEFLTPPKCISGLTIMPKVFTIPPKGYTTSIIRFDSAMREYGPFTYEEIEKELGIKLSDGLNQLEKDIPIEGNENKLLEEKIKKEVEDTLNNAEDAEGGGKKGKKVDNKKDVKKEAPKKLDPKKDKKAIEEEEKKKKEEEEQKLKEEEAKKEERLKNFNLEDELKHFGAETIFKNIENDRSCHWKFMVPLFYRNHIDKEQISSIDQNNIKLKTSFLEVHTCCVEKTLVFDNTEIDFGEVSVETRKTVNLILTNKSNKVAKLKMKPLILTNCFRIVNAIRDIQPQSSFIYIVEFLPLKDLPYFDDFTIYTNETQSTVHLKGIGVKPEVTTTVNDGILFMGNSVMGNTIEKTFDIISKSNFKISYEIKSIKTGKKNKTGLQPFCYVPYTGDIEPNGKVTITVTFNGDHQDFENYFDFILIDVPNQKVENKILVTAYCWERQVYWKELVDIKYPDNLFLTKVIEQDVFVDCLKLKSTSLSSNNDRIVLIFTPENTIQLSKEKSQMSSSKGMMSDKSDSKKESRQGKKPTQDEKNKKGKEDNKIGDGVEINEENEKCFKRKLVIGNCKLNDAKSEKNGNYEIILDKDCSYFTCDNPKGAINSGSEVILTFTYKKPEGDPLTKDIKCLKGIGMWVEAKCELKINGGFIQPNMSDNVSIDVILRAYVEQI